jgi:hypothetical protein
MSYIPIQGLTKKSGYIPISGLPQIAEPMAESTIAVAPQTGGILSGLKGLASSAYQGAKGIVGGFIEKVPITRIIANIQSGAKPLEAIKKGFAEPEKEVQIATEREQIRQKLLAKGETPERALFLSKSALTSTQMAEAQSMAAGFLGGMKEFIPEIEGAKKLGYKISESVKGFTNKLFKYRIQKGQDLMYANTPEEIASLTGQLKKVGGAPEIPKELEPLAQEARKYKSAEEFVKGYKQFSKAEEQAINILNKYGDKNIDVYGSFSTLARRGSGKKLPDLDVIIEDKSIVSDFLKLPENQQAIKSRTNYAKKYNASLRPQDRGQAFASEYDAVGSLTIPEKYQDLSNKFSDVKINLTYPNGETAWFSFHSDGTIRRIEEALQKEQLQVGRKPIKQALEDFKKVATKSQLTDFYTQATKVSGEGIVPKAAVNIERLNIPQEAKQTIIKASEEIKPQLEVIKGKPLSNSEVIESAQQSEILRKGVNREATLKSEAALLKTRQHLAELAKNEKLTPEFIDTLKVVSEEATKRGRELQALGIEADPILGTTKAKLVKQLLDMGIETQKIIEASKGIDFNNAKQVMEFYRKFVKPTLPEIIDEYRYINMLSSPKTQIVNTFSNILQATVLRPATRLASGVVDTIKHTLTGKEQEFYISQVPAYYKGALNSFGDALSEAMKVMRGEQQIYRPDIRNIPTGVKVFKPFQIIPRLMEASDVFFRKLSTSGEVEALMSKGVSEAEAITKASKTAEELVFRKALDPMNKTGQGVVLSAIDKLTTAVYKLRNVPGFKWFIPFVQTPMNILKQGIEYSPLGVSTLVGNTAKIEQFGKTLVGTTIFAGAGWLALKDLTTWAVPTSPKEKDAFYAAGMQPYAIKLGDNWVSYSRLGPLAYPIAMAAAIKFYTKDNPKAVGDNEFQKITKILSGIAQFFTDQSYIQGIGDFVNVAQGDMTALTRAASQIPSQLIPLSSLQRWIANIIDPVFRKTDKTLSVDGIIENLKSGIPVLTTTLPAYTTPSGEIEKRPYPYFNPISPISISKESKEWKDYFNTLQQVSRERVLETKSKEELKSSAQSLYDKMKALPQEEAKRQFDDLIKNNPDLAQEVSDLASGIKLDYKESFLKSLGVENGQRAKYIVDEINKLKTKDEKKLYYQNLIDKKVITKQVSEQVLKLLK